MDPDDLYREIILDHYRHPRHAGRVDDGDLCAEELNPTCGDHIRLAVTVRDGRIAELRHESRGCAISTASASIMCAFAIGRASEEFVRTADEFIARMRGDKPWAEGMTDDLAALGGVRDFPLRVKCATMCWLALRRALAGKAGGTTKEAPPADSDRSAVPTIPLHER